MLELYENIKKFRLEKGMSQSELAALTGYTDRSSIAKIESGESDLTLPKIIVFAKALRVSAGELMGDVVEYGNNDLKPIGKLNSKDIELIEAYHNAPEHIKDGVRRILGLVKE